MTLSEFKSMVKKLGLKFSYQEGSACLRTPRGDCPICAVARQLVDYSGPGNCAWLAGELLDMRRASIRAIIASADGRNSFKSYSDKLRNFLEGCS